MVVYADTVLDTNMQTCQELWDWLLSSYVRRQWVMLSDRTLPLMSGTMINALVACTGWHRDIAHLTLYKY